MRKELVEVSLAGLLLVSCTRPKAEEIPVPPISTPSINLAPFKTPTLAMVMEKLTVQGPCLGDQGLRDEGLATGEIDWPTFGGFAQGFSYGHRGIDIAGSYNRPINAAWGGIVAWVQESNYGYGNHLLVYHGCGISTLYAHLNRVLVTPGKYVEPGQKLGLMGSTGLSTGPHLHFEIKINGVSIDPLSYLANRQFNIAN
jgi:murein DD-endopeptidase MepM/ murein hydrolase activator NlpD